jgi:hypothetical protein
LKGEKKMKYLVIKCKELGDQWECDADREPLCVVDDYTAYDKCGYEIYRIHDDGSLEKIREYDDITDEYIAYCEYDENESQDIPVKVIRLKDGSRYDITKSDIKKWLKQFDFTDLADEIETDLNCSGVHGELIHGHWCVIGEAFDDVYPTGD